MGGPLCRRDDGLFELREEKLPTGLAIAAEPKPKDGRIEREDMITAAQAVGERKPIPGVALPVGRPILRTSRYKMQLQVEPGRSYAILVRPEGMQGHVLLRIEAPEVKAPKG